MDRLLTLMRALADPTRLRIAILIRQLELSVGELVQILGQSQPRVSRHIRILDEAGLAERRKEGSWVFLRPGPQLLEESMNSLFAKSGHDDADIIDQDLKKLELVRAGRAEMAASYFEHHASEWDSLRSLHVAESEVEAAMQLYLNIAPLGRVLDIGTGTGRMIELFAHNADHFTAIDNSAEMLRLARAKLAALPAGGGDAAKIDIMLGDFNALPLPDASQDTILFHQVLHYAQAPERVIAEAARVLAPSGRMMIVDFAPHDKEELRSIHAHARLGFSNDLILRSFANGGLHLADHATLDGGELTVKIWLGQKQADGSQRRDPDSDLSQESSPHIRANPQIRPQIRPQVRPQVRIVK
ncbi:ArsR/SmtB family transcription factor [Sphingorhabdus arenilitoris]|uniref:ArsR/SmtB family transcription factor n=1 Tax=Sphingorhabdus arenilitoris TaxID=1490041 RepID=A0ABV8RL22_9SPHN